MGSASNATDTTEAFTSPSRWLNTVCPRNCGPAVIAANSTHASAGNPTNGVPDTSIAAPSATAATA